jgi:hypothetical protein
MTAYNYMMLSREEVISVLNADTSLIKLAKKLWE